MTTLLVTGRVLEDLRLAAVDFAAFDAVVAENGAVVWFPASGRTIHLGMPPPEEFLGELRAQAVPFHVGAVIVGTWEGHAGQVLGLVRRLGLDVQLVFNRAAVMLLPTGVNKAVGVSRALEELGRSARNLVAFGDAENDLPLLAQAELGVAARGSVPAVGAVADERLTRPGADGVARRVQELLDCDGVAPTPPRRIVRLGTDTGGEAVGIPGSGTNLLVTGDPRSGKSWLAGLVAERLVEQGYRLCIVDPEGDYVPLGRRPGVLVLGHTLALPAAAAAPQLLDETRTSLVLNLASLTQVEKRAYVAELLPGLAAHRAATGLPHWVVVDEAHYFFPAAAPAGALLEGRTGNVMLVTYRPSALADAVHGAVGAHLVTRTTVDEERYFMGRLLASRGAEVGIDPGALEALDGGVAGLLIDGPGGRRWQVFVAGERLSAHVHHGRKYADVALPEACSFRFLASDGAVLAVAHNVREFCATVAQLPLASLRHHLLQGDFSRWAADALGDADLAGGFRKLEHTTRGGVPPSRAEVIRHLHDRYVL